MTPSRANFGALCAPLCSALLLLGGCSFVRAHTPFHHHNAKGGCGERAFVGTTDPGKSLQVPPGLSAPDSRGAVKVPELNEPERVRAASEPCLAEPPSYGGYLARPAIRQAVPPPPAPAPPASAAPGDGSAR